MLKIITAQGTLKKISIYSINCFLVILPLLNNFTVKTVWLKAVINPTELIQFIYAFQSVFMSFTGKQIQKDQLVHEGNISITENNIKPVLNNRGNMFYIQ